MGKNITIFDRAAYAINCLTTHCDKSRGYIPYFYTYLNKRPPVASLAVWSYGDGLGRSIDSLTLLRSMMSDHIGYPADIIMRKTLLSLIADDGLSWCPAEPWTMNVPHTRPAHLQYGTLMALTSLYQFTHENKYRKLAEKNILGVKAVAKDHGEEYSYFPHEYYTHADGWCSTDDYDDPYHKPSVFSATSTVPLMRYFSLTGFEPALELASKLINWAIIDHGGVDGLFCRGHFHACGRLLVAMLLRGILTGNSDDINCGEKVYQKACSLGTRSGWFPEQIDNPNDNRSNLAETCCLTDMIEAAILLAQNVNHKYWHDVERYALNHLFAQQIVSSEWFDQLPEAAHKVDGDAPGCCQNEKIKESIIGGFAGWGGVTAMSDGSPQASVNQHCCNASGARALYDVWRYAVEDDGEILCVNLHINRDHKAVKIAVSGDSEAKMVLNMQAGRKLFVLIPEDIRPQEIHIMQNVRSNAVTIERGYLNCGDFRKNDEVIISYPLKSRVTHENVAGGRFKFCWSGSTVKRAEPAQLIKPYFTEESHNYG